jgi:2-enoate reductase
LVSGVNEYVEITDKGLVILTPEGYKRTLEADSRVPVLPMKPNDSLLDSLRGQAKEIYTIGDCKEPKLIVDAIGDGYRIARSI